jgi:hypothetical protein
MKQVAMPPVLDNDVETPTTARQYPTTDLVRTYLQNAGSKFFGLRSTRREPQPDPVTATQDLWDYLGDFA